MIARIGFAGSSGGLRHALGFADEIRRRCVYGREAAKDVARDLGLDPEQTCGAVRILRYKPNISPERLALVVMRDWGMEDADVAHIFGRSVRWARCVRAQADEIRAEDPLPDHYEYVDSGLQESDPSPAEIMARAAELRRATPAARASAVPCFSWMTNAFVPSVPG